MGSTVIPPPPRLADVASVQPCPDGGVLVIPHILPLRIPADAFPLTVAEWVGITPSA